jgi:hypothetical protein
VGWLSILGLIKKRMGLVAKQYEENGPLKWARAG